MRWKRHLQHVAVVIVACCFLAHFTLVVIYLTPINPVKLRLSGVVNSYMAPVFQQNWHLFGPDPVSTNASLVGRCRIAGEDTPWVDITASSLVPNVERFNAPAFAFAQMQLTLIYQIFGQDGEHEPLLSTHCADDTSDRAFCKAREDQKADTANRAIGTLTWMVAMVCLERFGATNRDLEQVNVGIATVRFPRFSKRYHDDVDGDVSFIDLVSCNSDSRNNYPAWAASVRWANRAMLARISSADFVHTNGRPVALCAARNSRIARSSATTLRKMPRRKREVVSAANHRSTRFNHEA